MILGIDASRYNAQHTNGEEVYSFHLLNELIPMLGREHSTSVRLYTSPDFAFVGDLPFNVKTKVLTRKKRCKKLRFAWEMFIHPIDVLFVPAPYIPRLAPKKTVVTVHDVAFEVMKDSSSFLQYLRLRLRLKRIVKRAWKIIVPSISTHDDLIKYYKVNPEKIIVIPHGAATVPALYKTNPEEKERFLKHLRLQEEDLVIFFLGTLETRKNLSRLVEAFDRFLKEFPDWKLVLAGKRGQGFEKIWQTVQAHKLEESVIMPGYITEEEKLFLFNKCRVFAFPSWCEGFGLSMLEAFAHRRPVLTSKVSAMVEVAGNAAYLINPEKMEEMSVGLKRLVSDGMLVTQLIQKGEKQLEKFNWEKSAQKTAETLFGS